LEAIRRTLYGYLSALPRSLEGGAGKLLFATNAGMFDSNLKLVGLYVEQRRELVHANSKSGRGNFHMNANGIFYISATGQLSRKRKHFSSNDLCGPATRAHSLRRQKGAQTSGKLVKLVVERLAGDRDAKRAHVGEVGQLHEGLRPG
jgi:hypothetical protein